MRVQCHFRPLKWGRNRIFNFGDPLCKAAGRHWFVQLLYSQSYSCNHGCLSVASQAVPQDGSHHWVSVWNVRQDSCWGAALHSKIGWVSCLRTWLSWLRQSIQLRTVLTKDECAEALVSLNLTAGPHNLHNAQALNKNWAEDQQWLLIWIARDSLESLVHGKSMS